MNIFMRAVKEKARFKFARGNLSVECLWDVPLNELNDYVVAVRDKSKNISTAGYLTEVGDTAADNYKLLFEVSETVILTRLADIKAAKLVADNRQRRAKVLAIIASKEDADMQDQELSTLRELADSLK